MSLYSRFSHLQTSHCMCMQRPFAGSCVVASIFLLAALWLQVSLAALVAVSKLPAETLSWLASPDNTLSDGNDVPGLNEFNALPFIDVFGTTLLGISGINIVHEFGHAAVAAARNIKLGPLLFVPNSSLGTLGTVTRLESVLKGRTALWDLAAAGPALGLIAAAATFAVGLQVRNPSLALFTLRAVVCRRRCVNAWRARCGNGSCHVDRWYICAAALTLATVCAQALSLPHSRRL